MKTLIGYCSKHGSAEKCAKELSEKLNGDVELVNLSKKEDMDISKFDKVIIGGSIYAGQIQKGIKSFCDKNLDTLKEKNNGFFICCMDEKKGEEQLNNAFPQELLSNAVAKDIFGGEFRFSDMNFFERTIIKMISKSDKDAPPLDTKKDLSKISEEKINSFVNAMNKYSIVN